jgi:hypothetical protein
LHGAQIAFALREREICVHNYFFFARKYLSQRFSRVSALLVLPAMLAVLAGCGSGSQVAPGPTPPPPPPPAAAQTITGTAATGNPLAGARVTVQDSTGKTATAVTVADGTFSISVTGMTPPFMLAAVPVSGLNLYSVLPAMDMTTTNTQNVNITPITTLVMYELNAAQDPATMFNTRSFGTVTAGVVSAKETTVRSKLPPNSVNPIFSMMYGKFVAQAGGNDPYDTALNDLGRITSINAAGVGFSNGFIYASASGAVTVATITLAMTDTTAPFAAKTSISIGSPALITATVRNASGTLVPNAIVTFSADPLFGAFSNGANTALTNASGVASVTLTTTNTSGGASAVTANSIVAGAAVTSSLNYSIGGSTFSLGPIILPSGVLSAYGTASVSVDVLNNGVLYTTPISVRFSSACASIGKATLTPTVTTVNGRATASYLDNGCNNRSPGDTIIATLINGVTSTANLPVNAPSIGSIQFVSVITNPVTTPPMITLKGTGGTGRSETARVTFRVADSAGNPIGNTLVNFSLNTSVGGLSLSSASATSDPATGNVVTNVLSGTVATAVRVTATAGALSTQSDQLLISTGIPAQDSMSLSVSTLNIEGGDVDGVSTTLTARVADHFHNPVPDGTAISFTSEGGSVLPGCNTVVDPAKGGSSCTSVLTSQALRPTNGRVTVLAHAIGEEAFTDLNGNGTVDSINEMIDANGIPTDMPEAYVDYNENGVRDANEPFFDFNGNGIYDGPDAKYEGVLCTPGAAICAAQKSIDVRASAVVVFSTSSAIITINNGATIALPPCTLAGAGAPRTFTVTVVDLNGNAMPAGTTIAFSADNGTITSDASITVPNTAGCRTGFAGCPASAGSATFGNIPVTMKSDATFTAGPPPLCTDSNGSIGTFTVKVTSPRGLITTSSVGVTD